MNYKLHDIELKKLFSTIENYKDANKPISWAFKDYANQSNRKPNSIRNLYYLELSSLKNNPDRAKRLSIDLSKHNVQHPALFSNEEKNDIIKKIQDYVGRGYSVRKACMLIAGGDVALMIRYQNKYRCTLAKTKQENNNIIKMPAKKVTISDADIQGLFLGLIKLVKKNALIEAKTQFENQNENSNLLITKYMNDIEMKEKEILNLRQQISLVSKSNKDLKEKINCLKAKNITNTANKRLKEFLQQKQTSQLEAKSK